MLARRLTLLIDLHLFLVRFGKTVFGSSRWRNIWSFYATKYLGSTVTLRPELRFDHSWDARGYDNGKARNRLFFGADLIYKF